MSAECQTAGFQRLPSTQSCCRAPGPTADHCCASKQPKSQPTVNGLDQFTELGTWEDLADNRSKWQKTCLTGVQHFEEVRIVTAVQKRSRRKGFTSQSVPAAKSADTRRFICDDCGRQFTARIALVGNSRTHRK